jgi:hypothetical protein
MRRSIPIQTKALGRTLDVPALKAAGIITGLLLDLDGDDTRQRVLAIVHASLELSQGVALNGGPREEEPPLPFATAQADAGSSGE